MARKASRIAELRSKGKEPVVVEGGDSLFREAQLGPREKDAALRIARLILETNDRIGTDLFVPGLRDFAAGPAFLQEAARKSKTTFVAANLVDPQTGRPMFERFKVLERKGLRLGFTGVMTAKLDPAGPRKPVPGLTVLDPVEEAKAVVAELRKQADLVFVVAGLVDEETARLSKEVSGVDFLLLAHNQRGYNLYNPGTAEGVPALGPGNRGKTLGELILFYARPGTRFTDLNQRQGLERRIAQLRESIASRKKVLPEDGADKMTESNRRLIQRYEEQLKKTEQALAKLQSGPNRFTYETVALGTDVPDDREILEMIAQAKREAGLPAGRYQPGMEGVSGIYLGPATTAPSAGSPTGPEQVTAPLDPGFGKGKPAPRDGK